MQRLRVCERAHAAPDAVGAAADRPPCVHRRADWTALELNGTGDEILASAADGRYRRPPIDMSTTPRMIASVELDARSADGVHHTFSAGVGQPERLAGGEWGCRAFSHDAPGGRMIYGNDGLQALCLALSFLRLLLDAFIASGGRVTLRGESAELSREDLAAWFSGIGATGVDG